MRFCASRCSLGVKEVPVPTTGRRESGPFGTLGRGRTDCPLAMESCERATGIPGKEIVRVSRTGLV